jgi:two-component system, cell cycle response regulator
MTTRILRVRALGLSPHELSALKSVCRLSQLSWRPFGHELAEPGIPADIYVVAMDDPVALADWRANDPRGLIPFVAAGQLPPSGVNGVHLAKPFLASRLLAAMDVCATRLTGTTAVDSEPPPRADNVTQPDPETPVPSQTALPQRRGRSVLIVDDSATARRQIEVVLQGMDLQPHCVASGEEALHAIDGYHFDLILLDVVLPGTDGYQVCKAIRKNPRTKNISVIMLTSKTSQFDRIRGKFAGCDAYLTKPLDRAEFTAVMRDYLAQIAPAAVFAAAPQDDAAHWPDTQALV